MKHHNFEFGLPLYPHQTIGEAQSPDLKLEMDLGEWNAEFGVCDEPEMWARFHIDV